MTDPTAGTPRVLRERRGHVEIITLNRPEKRNALDSATTAGIGRALHEAEHDPDVRVLVLTGAGDRAFCAGLDLNRVGSEAMDGGTRTADSQRYLDFIREGYAKPVIAAVNGAAVAGGFELMLACDLAVAAEHAVVGLPEVRRGLVAGAGGTLLPLRIPRALALELGITGAPISAARAYAIGLVNRVVPSGTELDAAVELAGLVAANSPTAVRATRRLMAEAGELPRPEAWRRINDTAAELAAGPDAVEGARAFLEKRVPRWS